MAKKICYFVILLIIGSCTNPKLTLRYKKLVNDPPVNAEVTNGIEIFASARDIQIAAPQTSQYVLTDHGQAAYINAVATKAKDLDELQSNLFPDVSGFDKAPSVIDNTSFTKRLLLTVLNKTPYEADRITKVSIKIDLNTNVSNLKILTFDKIITEYQTVDLGSINLSNTLNMGATASYGIAGKVSGSTGGGTSITTVNNDNGNIVTGSPVTTNGVEIDPSIGVGVSAAYNRSYAEQINLKDRYIALTGYMKGDSLTFDEESVTGVNLTGNILSDIKFRFTNFANTRSYNVSDLTSNGKLQDANKIKIKVLSVFEPTIPNDLKLKVNYDITIRHVINKKGQRSNTESDDKIAYYNVKKSTIMDITLVTKDELSIKKWCITDGTNDLQITDLISNRTGVMYFTSYDNCVSFYRWLKKSTLEKELISNDYKLSSSAGDLNNLIGKATIQLFK